MITRTLALLALLSAVICATGQPLPVVGPGDYVINPGTYQMTSVLDIDVNTTHAIRGNCAVAGEVCVWIDVNSFGFNLTSANSSATLQVSGISFTNSQPSGMAALRLSSVLGSLDVNSVEFHNASSQFISGFPPASVSLSQVNISQVTAPTIIDVAPIYNPADPNFFPYMNWLRLSNVRAENNLPPSPSTNDSLIAMKVQIIDLIEFTDSHFANNTNLLRIGDTPVVFISDGVSQLAVRRCTFTNHALITSPGPAGQPDIVSPLFLQTTTSSGAVPWIFEDNTFSDNDSPFINVVAVPTIVIQRNQFLWSPKATLMEGMIKGNASLINNTYVHSGLYSLTSDPDAVTTTQLVIKNDVFDFQMDGLNASMVVISQWSSVKLQNVTFKNISPGNITSVVAAVYFELIDNITATGCTFRDVSLSNSSLSSVHTARFMVGFNDLVTRTTTFALSNNDFGAYDEYDTTTADIAAQASLGRNGVLRLIASPASALINISRLCATTSVEVYSPLAVRESLFNKADYGIGQFTLFGRLTVNSPMVLFGRVQLTLGPRVDFIWTPQLNGTIQVESVPTFTPKVIASATLFAVDLGDGLSVPKDSEYLLVSDSRATLPIATSVIASWSGRTNKPGFIGTIVATNSHTVGTDTLSEISMKAMPLCSVACVVGACNTRDFCTCDAGWSGLACTCLDTGRPVGVSCGSSTTNFEWITSTPQIVSPSSTLLVPSKLTYYVNNDMSISGTLHLTSGSKLVVAGQLSVAGNVIMDNDVLGYPFSCDFYTPTMISTASMSTTNAAAFSLIVGTGSAPVCTSSSKKRDFANDNFDALIVVNDTAQMSGTLSVDVSQVDVPAGKQQQVKAVAVNGASQLDVLAVTVHNKTGICTSTSKLPTLITVTLTRCNGTYTKVQWWWYGAPIIGVVFILIIFAIVVAAVPKYRRAIFPYSAK